MSTIALWKVSTKIISSKSMLSAAAAGVANRQFSGSALTTPGYHSYGPSFRPLNSLSDGRYTLCGVRMMHLSPRLDDIDITLTAPLYVDPLATGHIRWLKATGESITVGTPVAEIESDKATVEIYVPSPVNGFLKETLTPEGGTVKSGQKLATIRVPVAAAPKK